MKVGVLSDTHILSLKDGAAFAQKIMNSFFSDVQAILHAGDQVQPQLENCFYPGPWYAVRGNMDHLITNLTVQRIIVLAGKRIGMTHGWGGMDGIEDRVMKSFASESIDVLVYGHSHRPACRKVGTILLFNPGSPTERRSAAHHTAGILNINTEVTGEIIRLD